MIEHGTTHRLHLLRHAKSSWKEKGVADRDRSLNKRGRESCELIAAMLPRAGVRPDAVVVSPARRTAETYELIEGGLRGDYEHWTERRLYGASTDELLAVIQELPEAVGEALVIAHNPAVESLALSLAGDAGPGAARCATSIRRAGWPASRSPRPGCACDRPWPRSSASCAPRI